MALDSRLEDVLRELAADPALVDKAREALAVLPAIIALRHAFENGQTDGLFRRRTATPLKTRLAPE